LGMYLIALAWSDMALWIAVLKVCVGLGLVIFVHELGHFAVAKWCGVKCEKFYVGFDLWGWKFCKFTWGETEYGLGIFPFGGYVKMLGQEDNPARLKEEIERAKQQSGNGQESEAEQENGASQTVVEGDDPKTVLAKQAKHEPPPPEQVDVEAAQRALFDPRSYLAQNVPKRMAIISAGVIMNLVFAYLAAVAAFELGVQRKTCVVGGVLPGAAAWQEGVKVGDEIIEVDGRKVENFRKMRELISLGDATEDGRSILVRRPGAKDPKPFTVMPDSGGLIPVIGILSSPSTTLPTSKRYPVAWPGSPAAECSPSFAPGDKIVKIDQKPVKSYLDLHSYLALNPDRSVQVTVERPAQSGSGKQTSSDTAELVSIEVAPAHMRRFGLVMAMGEISAVQADSPAETAGIRAGDKILKIDDLPPGDPMTLPQRQRRPGQTITLTISREAETDPIEVEVELREADWYETPLEDNSPISWPALGIAYYVLGNVRAVIEDSPAGRAGLRANDRIVAAKLIPPDEQTPEQRKLEQSTVTIEFNEEHRNWPSFIFGLQELLPGTKVELHWQRQEEEQAAMLLPVATDDWFNPDRGFLFKPATFPEVAKTHGEALRMGAKETLNATLVVYRFLRKLGTQISPKALGGPISIFSVAKRAAEQSTADLLIFLTLLNANLAVINFLPIPLLDGGHMVLLTWEGIRGKPANERVQMVLTYIGLFFILSLMFWVIGLDAVRLIYGP